MIISKYGHVRGGGGRRKTEKIENGQRTMMSTDSPGRVNTAKFSIDASTVEVESGPQFLLYSEEVKSM